MNQTAPSQKMIHYECKLDVTDANEATLVEELLWTLDSVVSVTYCHDRDENLTGILVVGTEDNLEEHVKALLKDQTFTVAVHPCRIIQEEDWAETWKQHWRVDRVLPNLVIQPSWEEFTPEPGDIVLRLDPGSAFGTGTHETTQLMLLALSNILDRQDVQIKSCADVGCGSGILALYAYKRGVNDVVGVDNDLKAVDVTIENAKINNVKIQTGDSLENTHLKDKKYDLLVANILTGTLLELMPGLVSKLNPNAYLLLSGIASNQVYQMTEGLKPYPLQIQRVLFKGGWVGFVCQKTN